MGLTRVRDLARQGERNAADDHGPGDDEQQPGLAPARARPNRAEDRRESGGGGGHLALTGRSSGAHRAIARRSPAGSGRPGPLESKPDLADLDDVAVAEGRDLGHGRSVHERPVRAAEVLDVPRPPTERQDGVLCRDELVLDDDRVVDVAPDRGDRIEGERGPLLRLPAGRRHDDEPAELGARLAGGRPQIADEGPGDPKQEQVEQRQEEQPDDPDRQQERVHQPAAAPPSARSPFPVAAPDRGAAWSDSMIRIVVPIRSRSPSPRATESTRRSLTNDPLVLPRSDSTSDPRRKLTRSW